MLEKIQAAVVSPKLPRIEGKFVQQFEAIDKYCENNPWLYEREIDNDDSDDSDDILREEARVRRLQN